MCEIEKLLREEVISSVETLRSLGFSDEDILKQIKKQYDLNDFEAESFVKGTKEPVAV